jgi:hypothetical protein
VGIIKPFPPTSFDVFFSDPKSLRTDVELISMLQRAQLLPRDSPDPTADKKFSLGSTVSDEGSLCSAFSICHLLTRMKALILVPGRSNFLLFVVPW